MASRKPVAVVTGGGVGIGRAIALKLGGLSYRVAICGRRSEPLQAVGSELAAKGAASMSAVCDVARLEDVRGFFNKVHDKWGGVDCLVNNAGTSGLTRVTSPDYRLWDAVIRTNIDSLYFCTASALEQMPDGGRIVNISSILGKFGVAGYAAYCTSKHAVVGFTKAVALELAPRKITVNALCPGWVETDMAVQGMRAGAESMSVTYEEFRRRALAAVPLGEIIQPEEVADLVAFLASPAGSNITGQSMNICGGQVMT